MSYYLQWLILRSITGSPIGSALFLVAFWFVVDRYTLGVLPDPFKFVARWRRERQLAHAMRLNPNDRRARLERAQLLLQRGQAKAAVAMLKPNLEHGDDDLETVFTLGAACAEAGYVDQGEKLLAHVIDADPDFRVGEVYLVLGRTRLQRRDYAQAKAALDVLLTHRQGTVEGRVLLARALDGLGDDGRAALMKDEAWAEFSHAPRFQRRVERWWAWRARPSRPALYAAVVVLVAFVVFKALGPVWRDLPQPTDPPESQSDADE